MSAPYPPLPAWAPPPSAGPPPLAAARVHSVVALCVIGGVGLLGALMALSTAATSAAGCVSTLPAYYRDTNPYCSPALHAFLGYSSVLAVVLACGLAVVGIARARVGGHHRWPLAAWAVYVGFCVAWWSVLAAFS